MEEEEIDNLIKIMLDDNEVVLKKYFHEGSIYVDTVSKDFVPDDDRYATVGGRGPLRISISNKTIERIHYLDFPSELIEEKPTPSIEEIIEKAANRRYINEKDIVDFLLNVDENGHSNDESYHINEFDRELIGLEFNNKELENRFRDFFNRIGVKFLIDKPSKILIERELPDS